jgi:hypothetical protein
MRPSSLRDVVGAAAKVARVPRVPSTSLRPPFRLRSAQDDRGGKTADRIVRVTRLPCRADGAGDLEEQIFGGVGFADDGDEAFVVDDGFGEAGDEQDGKIWQAALDVRREIFAVHLGHQAVGDDQIPGSRFEQAQAFGRGGCAGDDIAAELEHAPGDVNHRRLVIHEENPLENGWWFDGHVADAGPGKTDFRISLNATDSRGK